MSLWAETGRRVSQRLAMHWAPRALVNRAASATVSFTFDDFPKSAATTGAAILKSRGVRGTFFVSGGYLDRSEWGQDYYGEEDLLALAADEHEIGCHTFSHMRLPGARPEAIDADLTRNADFVRSVLGEYVMSSFAYPNGQVSISTKAQIAARFPIARGIRAGVNEGVIDFQQLRAIPLERRSFDFASAKEAFRRAKARNGWLIFFTHDVSDEPSPYGTTPSELARLVDTAMEEQVEVLPVKSAAGKARFASPAKQIV
jgi:peptidoglycan/xylan/chitin deacetylase (PgdA/CDA1 family)